MPSVSCQVVVSNKLGLHARPAMQFVEAANRFKASVAVEKTGEEPMTVNGKSIMDMMTLAAVQGTNLIIRADGQDAEDAVGQLAGLFNSKFGEEA